MKRLHCVAENNRSRAMRKIPAAPSTDTPAAKLWPSSAAPRGCPRRPTWLPRTGTSASPRRPIACDRHSARRSALLDNERVRTSLADLPLMGTHLGLALKQSFRYIAGHDHTCGRRRHRQDYGDRHTLDLAGRPASYPRSASHRRRCPSLFQSAQGSAWNPTWTRLGRPINSTLQCRPGCTRRLRRHAIPGAGLAIRSQALMSRSLISAAHAGTAKVDFYFRAERASLPAHAPDMLNRPNTGN